MRDNKHRPAQLQGLSETGGLERSSRSGEVGLLFEKTGRCLLTVDLYIHSCMLWSQSCHRGVGLHYEGHAVIIPQTGRRACRARIHSFWINQRFNDRQFKVRIHHYKGMSDKVVPRHPSHLREQTLGVWRYRAFDETPDFHNNNQPRDNIDRDTHIVWRSPVGWHDYMRICMMNCVKLRERDVISSLRFGCEPRSVFALKGFDVIICSSLL